MTVLTKSPPENPIAGPKRRLTSLRTSLFLRFGLLGVGAVFLFALAYVFFGLFPLVNRTAAGQFDTAIKITETTLREPFVLSENIVRIASEWAGPQGPAPDRPEPFNAQFRPVLKSLPQATSIVAGTTDGFGWLLLQLPDKRWHNRFTDVGGRQQQQLYFDWQEDRLVRRYLENVDYDPRQRLWFKQAMAAPADGSVHWTPPYRFFTTGEPGITVSLRRDLPGERSLVFGLDLKLIDISATTSTLVVGQQGYVMVLTADGKVLGLPRSTALQGLQELRKMVLNPAEELGLEPVSKALALWRKDPTAYLKPDIIEVQGERWLFAMHPFHLAEQTFWIAAFAPADDFSPPFYDMGKAVAVSLVVVLLLTFILARRQARRISLPLEALVVGSGKIARLDFSENPPVSTRWQEISDLVSAQENMRVMLRNSQATVKAQAEELAEQVEALRATEAQLQIALHQEQIIFDNTLTGILFVKDRKILRANRRASELFGYDSTQAMVGESTEFMFAGQEEFVGFGRRAYGSFGDDKIYREELWLKRRDGSSFWGFLEGRALDITDPTGGGAVWTVSDLTERKEMDRLKSEMLSVVSHEVRTPLTGMMGYAELLMEKDFPPAKRREYLGIILDETGRLAELFDNFLNLQRLKGGRPLVDYRQVDIAKVLEEAVNLYKMTSRKHRLQLDCQEALPTINGDEEQLHRAFVNLISNAIKYSPEGGAVTVAARRAEGAVLIQVADQGIGIPVDARERVFEPFYRLDNRDSRHIGGTGLGLALVKETVQRHGGQIWVEGECGKGSTFFISLPAGDT